MNSQTNQIPTRIDHFNVHFTLGQGIQAQAFLCTNQTSKEIVCIKLYGDGQENFISYERQVKMLKLIKHQNIIEIKSHNPEGYVEYPGNDIKHRPFIVMEFAYYGDLFNIAFYKEGLSQRTAKFIFIQILLALRELQEQKISHRDIKLQNILLTSEFKVKFIDFGLSSELYLKIDEKNQSRNYGTTYTKAPEIYKSQYNCEKIDIFACGVVLFSLLFGRLPFSSATYSNKQYSLIHSKRSQQFWKNHSLKNKKKKSPLFNNNQFKQLMIKIYSQDTQARPSINDLFNNQWLMNNIAGQQEAAIQLRQKFEGALDENKKKQYQLIHRLMDEEQRYIEISYSIQQYQTQ